MKTLFIALGLIVTAFMAAPSFADSAMESTAMPTMSGAPAGDAQATTGATPAPAMSGAPATKSSGAAAKK